MNKTDGFKENIKKLIVIWRKEVMAGSGNRDDRKRGNRANVVNGGGKCRCVLPRGI